MSQKSVSVYIAAPWEEQRAAREIAAALAGRGIGSTARWHLADDNTYTDEWARICLQDVAACDVLIAWNPEAYARSGTGGRHVELGVALALGRPVVVVGDRTNIFHHLVGVNHVPIGALASEVIDRIETAVHAATAERELSGDAASAALQRFVKQFNALR